MFTFPQVKLCILIYPYFFEYLLDCSAKGYSTLILYFSYHAPEKSVKVKESENHPVESDSLRPHGLYSPWNSPGQNTGVGSFSLLQGIFPTQGSNPGLPSLGDLVNPGIEPRSPKLPADSLPAVLQGKPKNTGVGSLTGLQGIFPTQQSTRVSCIAGRFFTN